MAVLRPGQHGAVQVLALDGEADVLGGEDLLHAVGELALLDLGGAFAVLAPDLGIVDGLAVDGHPVADFGQHGGVLLGDSAVGLGADVQKQRAVLGDDVHQVADEALGGLKLVALGPAPGVAGDGGVGLPEEGLDLRKLAALDVRYGTAEHEGLVLVVDGYLHAPLGGAVVVIGRELLQIGLHRVVLDPPVEVYQLGAVLVHDLAAAAEPVLQVLVSGGGLGVQVVVILGFGHGGPVKIAALHRLLDVGVKLLAVAHEEPVLHAVGGGAQGHAAGFDGFLQFTQDVAAGAHFSGIPVGDVALVHLEAVMMLRHGHDVLRAGLLKQVCPGIGRELLRLEHGDEILVAEILVGAVGLEVMLILAGALDVHAAGIPLAGIAGHGIHAPMDENAEFGAPVPIRHLETAQGLPGVLVGALFDHAVNLCKVGLHIVHGDTSCVVFNGELCSLFYYISCICKADSQKCRVKRLYFSLAKAVEV